MCKQGMEENFELSELRTTSEEATAHPRPQVRVTGAPLDHSGGRFHQD